jgi:hypothetical protein
VQRSPGFPTVLRPWFRTRPLCSWRCDDAGGGGVLEQQRSSVHTHTRCRTHIHSWCTPFLVLFFPTQAAWRWVKLLRQSSVGGSEYEKHRLSRREPEQPL